MKKKVVIFFNEQLPVGSAAATRAVAFAHILNDLGYTPLLLGVNYKGETALHGTYEGVAYEVLNFVELKYRGVNRLIREHALRRELVNWLEINCCSDNTAAVLLGVTRRETAWVYGTIQRKGIPVLKDVTEWYNRKHFSGLHGMLHLIEDRMTMYHWNVKCRNIIGISRLLQDYYGSHGCNTIRIPTILDTERFPASLECCSADGKVKILYAGSPEKKDYIVNAAKAISLLNDEERKRLQLHFYGAEEKDFINLGMTDDEIKSISSCFFCHGRVPHDEVKQKLQSADFTILLRPNLRYANAGFPTKVGESMAMGVPVIANLTSDIGLFLHDGVEGLVCENETPEACADAFRRALRLTREEKLSMRRAARSQAEQSFDYRQYCDKMKNFIEKART